jgi:hypothetical protein
VVRLIPHVAYVGVHLFGMIRLKARVR